MDTRQIEYIIKIADEKSITRAAEQLFITQSALSQQLQKLERELDTRLFMRVKSDWTPTPEGEIYLENAREMLRIKQRTYGAIADMVNTRKSFLSIGMTPGRGPDMFTHIYPIFHQKFPDVTVEPRELSVKRQQEEIRKGALDLGFMTLSDSQRSIDSYIDLFEEELYLAVPEDMELPEDLLLSTLESDSAKNTNTSAAASSYPIVRLSAFQDKPFVLTYKESTVRLLTDQIFQIAGFKPRLLFETSSNHTILSMIQAHLCIGIVPYYYIRQNPKGVRFFALPEHPTWKICASYRKDAYLSNAAKEFITLVKAYWEN